MLNAAKDVLAGVSSVSPSSKQWVGFVAKTKTDTEVWINYKSSPHGSVQLHFAFFFAMNSKQC